MEVNTISREELKAKIDHGDDFKLVLTMGEWAYHAMRIPGTILISSPEEGEKLLHRDDEIILYCSNEACVSSLAAYNVLVEDGYQNVRRYAGGLQDWLTAGYPLEGSMVEQN